MNCSTRIRHSLISLSTLAATVIPAASQAEDWKTTADVFFAAGDDSSIAGLRFLIPYYQTGKSLAYADFRVLDSDQKTLEFNLGTGYRLLNDDDTAIWGGYLSYDTRNSASGRDHNQITLGGEWLTETWDARANIYTPLSDSFDIGQNIPETEAVQNRFEGNDLISVTTVTQERRVFEEAFSGFDIEGGRLIPGLDEFEVRGYLGLYRYQADTVNEDANGVRVRFEARPRKQFLVSLTVERDGLFPTRAFLEFNVPLGRAFERPGFRTLSERMTQFAYRDIDIRESSRLPESVRAEEARTIQRDPQRYDFNTNNFVALNAERPANSVAIVHIDNSAAPGGDGTIERPYNSIASCTAAGASCSQSEVIFLHQGNSVISQNGQASQDQSAATPYRGSIQLDDNQDLIGDGDDSALFDGLTTGINPILLGDATAAAPQTHDGQSVLIQAGTNSRISGLRLGWDFIQPDNDDTQQNSTFALPANTSIPDVAVYSANENGVSLENLIITGFATNGDISDTSIQQNTSNNFTRGIYVYNNDPAANSSSTQSIEITESIIGRVLGDGVLVEAEGFTGNQAGNTAVAVAPIVQNAIIQGLSVTDSGRGIHAIARGSSNSDSNVGLEEIEQNINIRSNVSLIDTSALRNVFSNNRNEGVLIETINSTNNVTPASNQLLQVRNATINGNQGTGIRTAFANTPNNEVSELTVRYTNIQENEGSGIIFESNGGDTSADILDSIILRNISRNRTSNNGFGLRLDGRAIDCAGGTCEATVTANGDTSTRLQGFGIIAINRDSINTPAAASVSSTQAINLTLQSSVPTDTNNDGIISAEEMQNPLTNNSLIAAHSPSGEGAQLYLFNNTNNNLSSQTLNLIRPSTNPAQARILELAVRFVENPNGTFTQEVLSQVDPANPSIITGGAISPDIVFCDGTADGTATGINFEGAAQDDNNAGTIDYLPEENCSLRQP